MKLLNTNVLVKRLSEQHESIIDFDKSELKETSYCKVIKFSEKCSNFIKDLSFGDTICVYKHSGILVDGIENADMVVQEEAILFISSKDGDTTMSAGRVLAKKTKSKSSSELVFETESSDTIFDVIATSKDSSLKIGDKICCPIGTGVDIINLNGVINRVFHTTEILFKL